MSSERSSGFSFDDLVVQNLLFQNGISLDGRIPVTSYLLHEELPLLTGDTVTYDVTRRQHLSTKFDRIQYDKPNGIDNIVRTGCIRASTIRDLETGDVVDFSLGIKPAPDETKTNDLIFILSMLHEYGGMEDDPYIAYEKIVPTCHINSEEGVSLHNGKGFIMGFGPGFGERGLQVNDEFASRLLGKQASINTYDDGSFYEARCIILEADVASRDDFGNEIMREYAVEAGLRLYKESYEEASEACIAILQNTIDINSAIFDVVEPFYSIIVTDGKSSH